MSNFKESTPHIYAQLGDPIRSGILVSLGRGLVEMEDSEN